MFDKLRFWFRKKPKVRDWVWSEDHQSPAQVACVFASGLMVRVPECSGRWPGFLHSLDWDRYNPIPWFEAGPWVVLGNANGLVYCLETKWMVWVPRAWVEETYLAWSRIPILSDSRVRKVLSQDPSCSIAMGEGNSFPGSLVVVPYPYTPSEERQFQYPAKDGYTPFMCVGRVGVVVSEEGEQVRVLVPLSADQVWEGDLPRTLVAPLHFRAGETPVRAAKPLVWHDFRIVYCPDGSINVGCLHIDYETVKYLFRRLDDQIRLPYKPKGK